MKTTLLERPLEVRDRFDYRFGVIFTLLYVILAKGGNLENTF